MGEVVREFERERERERGFMMQGAKGVTMTRTSFVGARVTVRAPVTGRRACGGNRRTVTSAKYGEEGKYFDLNDIENTSGSWVMYGLEEGVKYPVSQEEFFKRASFGLARREALLGFIALGGG